MQSAFCVGVLQLLDSAEGQTVFTPEKLTDNVQFNFFGDLWYIPMCCEGKIDQVVKLCT